MISPIPRVPATSELLELYAQLAAADPPPTEATGEGGDTLEEVAQVRRALELLEGFRRAIHGGSQPSVEVPAHPAASPRIGPFEIHHELGRGGWGIVFRATDLRNDREVALKLPLLEYAGHPQFGRRFVREAKLLESLDHPNLVKVYEAGEVGLIWYLALQFCAGPNLKQWLKRTGDRLPPRQAAALIAAVADGLEHVHTRGILHRDVKPTNILLDEGQADDALLDEGLAFVPRLADFGLAKLTASSGETTHEGMLIGTPAYMSPEQALGQLNELGPPSDTFALGIVLFELLAGRKPFSGDNDLEIRYRVAKEPAPEIGSVAARIPPVLAAVCCRALAKKVPDRYLTARELADDLRRYLRGEPVQAPPVPRQRVARVSRRAALGLAALAAAGLSTWLLARRGREPESSFVPAAVPVVPDERLLGDWLFHQSELDGRRIGDRAGRMDATIQGEYAFAPAGKLQALEFDGKTTVVYLGKLGEEISIPHESFTAEAWVRVDQPLPWGCLVGLFQDNGPQEHGWNLGYFQEKFSFSLKASGAQNWMTHLIDTTPFELGSWYHVAGTYDGQRQRLFVNGRQIGESRLEKGPISYPKWGYYELGCYHDVDEFRTMQGALHEVRVYDAALSAEEIAAHVEERRALLPELEAPRKRRARVWTSLMQIIEPTPGAREK